MKKNNNDSRKKTKVFSPVNVPWRLWMAKGKLNDAYYEDNGLEKFTVQLEDGHKLSWEEVHMWINEAAHHYEQIGPQAEALRVLEERVGAQAKPMLQ